MNMNKLDKQYTDLLQDILDNGITKKDRTGTGTISVFGRQIRHKMSEGFPLITTKKMYMKGIITELLWFLRGDTNIQYLVQNDCHIWDGDAYQAYLKECGNQSLVEQYSFEIDPMTQEMFINKIKTVDEFAKKFGSLGRIYGKQWRSWETYEFSIDNDFGNNEFGGGWNVKQIDQIANLINDLKTNPDSRRLMVNAWNVGEIDQMVLPPCHYGFQVYTRELSIEERMNLIQGDEHNKIIVAYCENPSDDWLEGQVDVILNQQNIPTRSISLMWNQRSVDTFLGLPFNISSYGLLLEIIAKEVNMVPDELIGNFGDVHLYSNHIEQAKEQIGRELTDEERYNIWFNNNYETGMERFFVPNHLPDYDNDYYKPTPKRTREPYPLPTITLPSSLKHNSGNWDKLIFEDFYLNNYQYHPSIKADLSN